MPNQQAHLKPKRGKYGSLNRSGRIGQAATKSPLLGRPGMSIQDGEEDRISHERNPVEQGRIQGQKRRKCRALTFSPEYSLGAGVSHVSSRENLPDLRVRCPSAAVCSAATSVQLEKRSQQRNALLEEAGLLRENPSVIGTVRQVPYSDVGMPIHYHHSSYYSKVGTPVSPALAFHFCSISTLTLTGTPKAFVPSLGRSRTVVRHKYNQRSIESIEICKILSQRLFPVFGSPVYMVRQCHSRGFPNGIPYRLNVGLYQLSFAFNNVVSSVTMKVPAELFFGRILFHSLIHTWGLPDFYWDVIGKKDLDEIWEERKPWVAGRSTKEEKKCGVFVQRDVPAVDAAGRVGGFAPSLADPPPLLHLLVQFPTQSQEPPSHPCRRAGATFFLFLLSLSFLQCHLEPDAVLPAVILLLLHQVAASTRLLQLARGRRRRDHALIPVTVLLQHVEDVLRIWVHQVRPRLPQRVHNVVDEAHLQMRNTSTHTHLSSSSTPEPATFFVSTMVLRSASRLMCLDMSVDNTISMTILRSVCRCFLPRFTKMSQPSFCSSLNATARWWFSNTLSSLYMSASSEPATNTGWSTSWIVAAKSAAMTSSGVKTDSSAGVLSNTLVDCVTSAACKLLWNGFSFT
ncbi:hypothetical protein PR048_016665 [Dryococelus australis]|uniref:Uncharacterized protein n=1 Tax=Dryococelus australis TaxID=614101 RepID=A0ABQ9H7F7_9NEOP|nr:hypothetical protein PR048_016665 [Dryococelus australis]